MVVGVILIHGAGELTIASFVMFWFRLNLSVTNIMEVHDMSSGKIIFRFKQGIVHFHVWREGTHHRQYPLAVFDLFDMFGPPKTGCAQTKGKPISHPHQALGITHVA